MFKKFILLGLTSLFLYSNEISITSLSMEGNNDLMVFQGKSHYINNENKNEIKREEIKVFLKDKKMYKLVAKNNVIVKFLNKKTNNFYYMYGDTIIYDKITEDITINGNAKIINKDEKQEIYRDNIIINKKNKTMSSWMNTKREPVRIVFEKEIKKIKPIVIKK